MVLDAEGKEVRTRRDIHASVVNAARTMLPDGTPMLLAGEVPVFEKLPDGNIAYLGMIEFKINKPEDMPFVVQAASGAIAQAFAPILQKIKTMPAAVLDQLRAMNFTEK
jgi:hypothetical protein